MSNELVNFEELLKRDGSFLYTFRGVSMKPLLHQGKDVVIISSIERPIKKLDIVLYKVGERYVLHRVLKIKKDHYVIRGDNTYSEEFIPKDKVFGILTSYYKNDKLIFDALIKISDPAYVEIHIDTDEEVEFDLHQNDEVEFKKCGK